MAVAVQGLVMVVELAVGVEVVAEDNCQGSVPSKALNKVSFCRAAEPIRLGRLGVTTT